MLFDTLRLFRAREMSSDPSRSAGPVFFPVPWVMVASPRDILPGTSMNKLLAWSHPRQAERFTSLLARTLAEHYGRRLNPSCPPSLRRTIPGHFLAARPVGDLFSDLSVKPILAVYLELGREKAARVVRNIASLPITDGPSGALADRYAQYRVPWLEALEKLEFQPVASPLIEEQEKDGQRSSLRLGAQALPGSHRVRIDPLYLRAHRVDFKQVFILTIHETGHLAGINGQHQVLENIGTLLWEEALKAKLIP